MVRFACRACHHFHNAADRHAGRTCRCKQCGKTMRVPGTPPVPQPAPDPEFDRMFEYWSDVIDAPGPTPTRAEFLPPAGALVPVPARPSAPWPAAYYPRERPAASRAHVWGSGLILLGCSLFLGLTILLEPRPTQNTAVMFLGCIAAGFFGTVMAFVGALADRGRG